MIAVDWCFRSMPYSMQQTEQIPNGPPRMGAESTITSNHPSTRPVRFAEHILPLSLDAACCTLRLTERLT